MDLVMLPMWMMSGIFFSTERFPDVVQPPIRVLPLTPLIDSMRAVMLEIATADTLLAEIAMMSIWSVVCFVLATKWLRWS